MSLLRLTLWVALSVSWSLPCAAQTLSTIPATPSSTIPAADPTRPPVPEASTLMQGLVTGAIQPLYRELKDASQRLQTASAAFCDTPNAERFNQLRATWVETMLAWQRTEALLFGPAVLDQADFHINFTPPKKQVIQNLLAGTEAITPAVVEKTGVGGQGLSTLEYLLFDRGLDKPVDIATVLNLFQGESGKRRCAYVQAASTLLDSHVRTVAHAWLDQTYHFKDGHETIDLLLGKLYQATEKITVSKLGKPMGIIASGLIPPKPYDLEAWRSDSSLLVIRANFEGIRRLLRDGGFLAWLRSHYTSPLAKQVTDALEQQIDMLASYPLPEQGAFAILATGDKQPLLELYQRSYGLQMSLKRQIAPLVGAQLGFNDNDGD